MSHKSYTVVLIPDANRTVRRFKLQPKLIIILALLLIMVVVTAVLSTLLFIDKAHTARQLEQQLAVADHHYEEIISGKERNIEDLQTQLTSLSEEADQFRTRMEEVKLLESQVKEMIGLEKTAAPAEITDGDPSDGGIGGEELPISQSEMESFLSSVLEGYGMMDQQITNLKTSLEETRLAVIENQEELRVTPSIWPTESRRITSLFGVRSDPFTGRARMHGGIDFGGTIGDPVYATADGTVVTSGKSAAEGLSIHIDHENGMSTKYMHLSKLIATHGTLVKKGEIIGLLGSTGRSTGPHLHYEVLINGVRQDPTLYLDSYRKE